MRCSICSIKKVTPVPDPLPVKGQGGVEVHGGDYKLTNILYFDFYF